MNHTFSRDLTLMVLVASLAVAGCKGKENAATGDTTAASSMAMPDTSKLSAANGAVAASLSDANIAGLHDEVNVADSTLAAAALPKLTDPDVRSFAKMMMGEHHALHVKGLQVEKAQNITPQLPTTDPFKDAVEAEQSALSSMTKGKSYDSTYIAHEVGIHQAVHEWAGKNMPQNPALQDYVKSAAPVIQRHLDRALDIETKFGGAMS
jgi:putative membrane protein